MGYPSLPVPISDLDDSCNWSIPPQAKINLPWESLNSAAKSRVLSPGNFWPATQVESPLMTSILELISPLKPAIKATTFPDEGRRWAIAIKAAVRNINQSEMNSERSSRFPAFSIVGKMTENPDEAIPTAKMAAKTGSTSRSSSKMSL